MESGMRRAAAVLILTWVAAPAGAQGGEPLKIGLSAMVSPRQTVKYYGEILGFVEHRLGRRVEMVQRESYDEMDTLLEAGEVSVAFICSGPYVKDHDAFGVELLVAPQSHGQPFYYAYIIVPIRSDAKDLGDLRGSRFAFTDPKSNTGALVPTYLLAKRFGVSPLAFFKEVVYSKSHDKSIEAVAKGLVDGASVDSLIYDYAAQNDPVFTSMTRILEKSPPYGIPPVVVRPDIDADLKNRLREILLAMHEDPQGKAILSQIMVDRFVVPKDEDYDSVREMAEWLPKTTE